MAQADLLNLTIAQAAPRLERRELSPVELTEAVLQRIGAVNATLNAYITVCAPQAREVAQATERMIRAGYYLGPLHGIPIALKDNIYTRGVRTTAGAKILADFVPDEDATVAARLKRAGAIVVGKTYMHEFAWAGRPATRHEGPCRTPWSPGASRTGRRGGRAGARSTRIDLAARA